MTYFYDLQVAQFRSNSLWWRRRCNQNIQRGVDGCFKIKAGSKMLLIVNNFLIHFCLLRYSQLGRLLFCLMQLFMFEVIPVLPRRDKGDL